METKKSQSSIETVKFSRIMLWVGAFVLATDSIGLIFIGEFQPVLTIWLGTGIVFISGNMWTYFGMGKAAKDERAAKISAKAGLYSWYVTLVLTTIASGVLGMPMFNVHPTAAQAVGGIILTMVTTLVCTYEYMSYKGITEE